ncbi:hypothetical protein SHI21_07795 [Bacteriovorax sp. PP10]|uniref:TonB C-terminal domain-containing protein n=1 Tax=Bacteriovorax antarcticus TaxID=3088717 RepID=A0ABU5VSR8_9BACT|nr:hypothetical protein [Bacteriovorax sp. PP10]MEA9356098.1 hypothetical protein [Bacteriovorax sp. PP10]
MSTLSNTTFKSVYASIGLHVVFVVLGSWAFYNNSVHTLELTGKAGGGGKTISLSGIKFVSKNSVSAPARSIPTKAIEKSVVTKTATKAIVATATTTDTVSVTSGAVSAAVTGGSGSGVGSGAGNGSGAGAGDFDQGHLFGLIKNFYETRLGATLNIRENQLIKIKLMLSKEGDILDAILVQGTLEMSALRRIISVAKNIPLKTFWNSSSSYPKEIIVPLVLTPG